jgi:FkbH-like protein
MTTNDLRPAMNKHSGEEELLVLAREGTLAREYPRVRRLVGELSGDALVRAGQLLTWLDQDEVISAHPAVSPVKIAITGHGTLHALVAPLTAELARHGLLLRPYLADFDSYVPALADPGSDLYAQRADLVACVLDPAVIADELPTPWRHEDAVRVLEEKLALLERLADRYGEAGHAVLVFNTIPLPHELCAQLVDRRSRAALGAAWREANARLLRLMDTRPWLVVLDLDPLLAEPIPLSDPRASVYVKAHLSGELLARYARELGHLARQITGRTKKCLVLDLDGTAWGGVLGEDGIDGIEVAGTYRGEAFRAFQKVVKQLAAQGVLVAVVSKNDLDLVRAALREHPGMTLREDDLVRVIANWRPKHDNLVGLAADLNIGVDNLVFVDDSPFECGLVRGELPEVAVVALDGEPAAHPGALLRDAWFDSRDVTAEDLTRTVRYREELVRKNFLRSFGSLDNYLDELGVRVRLCRADPAEVPRISQLTLRTNQFNLTTVRLQQPDVQRLLADPDATVLGIHAADRFGDNGLVGAIFLRREGDSVRLENFLLSCRVFARGIEQACLSAVLRHAGASGVQDVLGGYRPSTKNGKVADFYPMNGFIRVSQVDDLQVFRHDLAAIPAPPRHIELTALLGAGR